MSSQKKSSTKAKGMTPSSAGQRQGTNSKKSRSASKKANNRNKQSRVTAPLSVGTKVISSAALITNLGNAKVRVSHSELIGNLISTVAGGYGLCKLNSSSGPVARLRINPGSATLFNWLSTMGPNWENYRFLKCILRFVPRLSASQNGDVMISPDYDAADGQVGNSEQNLMNNRGTSTASVWVANQCKLDVAAMNRLFKAHSIMSDARFANTSQDAKTIDAAQVFIGADVDVAGVNCGRLWVDYEVELMDPQSPTDPINKGGASFDILSNISPNSGQPIASSSGLASASEVGLPIMDFIKLSANLNGLTFPTGTIGRFTKDYSGLMTMILNGTAITANAIPWTSSDLNSPAGTLGDIQMGVLDNSGVINSTGTKSSALYSIVAKAGDYLKLSTLNASTLTSILMNIAGSTAII